MPRIVDVTSFGGTVKRYEIQPDPDRLKRYGITLAQLQNAVANCNANVGGDYLFQGPVVENVRGIGLIGGGLDPMQAKRLFEAKDFPAAADFLRTEENRRLREIRSVVIASVNNSPVKVDDVVEGGPLETCRGNRRGTRRGTQYSGSGSSRRGRRTPDPARAGGRLPAAAAMRKAAK